MYRSKPSNMEGNSTRLVNMATNNVVDTKMPKALVPSKVRSEEHQNPKNSTMLVYIMETPVSRTASNTASRMFQPCKSSSCRYLASR